MFKQVKSPSGRAYTRHQLERAKKKAFAIAKLNAYLDFRESQERREERLLEHARHLYKNRAKCSCAACCNARRSPYCKGVAKLTMQERRHIDVGD